MFLSLLVQYEYGVRPEVMTMTQHQCLIVPGLNNSGPRHWQTRWEQVRPDCARVELGAWSNPHRSHWITKLDLAVLEADRPVVLVGHSLGCMTIAWWAALAEPEHLARVRGALLVAPPDVEGDGVHEILRRFAPAPRIALPFPAIVVASRDDPYATIERSAVFAARWGAAFVDAGHLGHINADSFLGDWPEGQRLLDSLLRFPAGGIDLTAEPFADTARNGDGRQAPSRLS